MLKLVKLEPNGSGKIRIFDVSPSGRSPREHTGSEMIGNLPESAELYAEEIPVEELQAGEGTKIVNVFHYSRDPSRTHGVPCKFVLHEVSCLAVLVIRVWLTVCAHRESPFLRPKHDCKRGSVFLKRSLPNISSL